MTTGPLHNLKTGHYRAILADPPWTFQAWYAGGWRKRPDGTRYYSSPSPRSAKYPTMKVEDIAALPVADTTADDCVLFLWACWPNLTDAFQVIDGWGFTYKTCAFCWVKGNSLPLFPDDFNDRMGLGYWTRANSEVCLLATKGKPKRKDAGVRQVIQAPLREHSRKPDETHERIERLVDGPYLELFARQRREGWDCWGNEVDKFGAVA